MEKQFNLGDELDSILFELLDLEQFSKEELFRRSVNLCDLKGWYAKNDLWYPPLDAEQRRVFDMLTTEAKMMGLER